MNYNEAHNYIYNEIGDEGENILLLVAEDKIAEGIALIKKLTNCDDITAKALWTDVKTDFGTSETNAILKAEEIGKQQKTLQDFQYRNNAECPYCHSKNTKKISGLSKAGSVAMFGVFAVGKVSKQWYCNQCKSDF